MVSTPKMVLDSFIISPGKCIQLKPGADVKVHALENTSSLFLVVVETCCKPSCNMKFPTPAVEGVWEVCLRTDST